MSAILAAAQSVLAVVLGYAVMVILLTIVQEGLFGGIEYGVTPWLSLGIAGGLSVLCGTGGGLVSAATAGRRPYLHAGAMGVLVIIETTALLITRDATAPLWFDLLASASLIGGILAGAWLFRIVRTRSIRPIPTAAPEP